MQRHNLTRTFSEGVNKGALCEVWKGTLLRNHGFLNLTTQHMRNQTCEAWEKKLPSELCEGNFNNITWKKKSCCFCRMKSTQPQDYQCLFPKAGEFLEGQGCALCSDDSKGYGWMIGVLTDSEYKKILCTTQILPNVFLPMCLGNKLPFRSLLKVQVQIFSSHNFSTSFEVQLY